MRTFDVKADVLVNQMKKHVNGEEFDVCSYVTLYTLDVICGKDVKIMGGNGI